MDELRESSLLFSLERLYETERQRVEREARELQRKHDAELALVAEVAEQRRKAAEEQRAAAQRLQTLQAERQRIEQERIDALQRATIERARSEVEAGARAEQLEQEREHQRKLAAIRERERSARRRVVEWVGAGGFVLMLSFALGSYAFVIRPAHLERVLRLQSLLDATERSKKAGEQALVLERKKVQELETKLTELERSNAVVPVASKREPALPRARPTYERKTPRRPAACPDNGDPLQGCLGGGSPR